GRALYDNLVKYIRFQMATLVGFIASFLGAAIFAIAGGIPFTPLQVLWVNFAIDIPIAIALGFGAASPGLMERKPRPVNAPVVSRGQWVVIVILGLLMALGSLLLLAFAQPVAGVSALVAGTMAFTAFTFFNVFTGLTARDETQTMFTRNLFEDRRQVLLFGLSLLLAFLVTELGFLQRIFETTALTFNQWLVCIGVAATLVVVDEVIKFFLRRSRRAASGQSPATQPEADRHDTDTEPRGADSVGGPGLAHAS
ncbi:MAG TPA: cation-translocating P-type ATPase C-terminal domain-containing protein, partial [Ktedonobacterales bacterium]|nr:cation-translocating P-type ATPase C-terminal domain-containing protein [Ktedonobacterales bacterium]